MPRARLLGVFCFVLALLFLHPFASAQPISPTLPQFDTFIGYDGVVPESDWFPVVCEVRNEGPSFNAVYEFRDGSGGLVRRIPVELPTGTLKRFSFPMFASGRYGSRYIATLRDEKGRVVAENGALSPRFHISWQSHLLAALPGSAAGTPVFPEDASRNFSIKPVAATGRLQPEMVPDNPIALQGMDSLYLNSQRAVDLSERQVEAILSWLHGGGHLIVGIDAVVDVTGVPWLKSLVPGQLGSVRTVDINDGFDNWLRAAPDRDAAGETIPFTEIYRNLRGDDVFNDASIRLTAIDGATGRTELTIGGLPAIVSQRSGRGKVSVLLFNPEQEPLRSWKLRPYFWARLDQLPGFLISPQSIPNQGSTSVDGVVGAMVDSKQIRKLPVSALLGLLVVYLLVIGPLDQWWLKRINRQMLTWITFPCYVVLFSLLIYFIGYKLRAGESEWNEILFVDVVPKGNGAELRGTTYGSLYSPVNASYNLEGRQRFATLRGDYLGATSGRSADGDIGLNADQYNARVSVPVWTSQSFIGQWLDEGPMPLTASIKEKPGVGYELALTNRELPPTSVVRVAIGRRLHSFKLPGRNQTETFDLPANGGSYIADFIKSGTAWFYQAASQRNQGFGSDEARLNLNPVDATTAITLCRFGGNVTSQNNFNYFSGQFMTPGDLDLSGLLNQDYALVLVWCEGYAPTEPMNLFQPRRSDRSSLLRLAVPLNAKEN